MQQLVVFTFCQDTEEDRIRMIAEAEGGEHRCAYWLTRRLTRNLLKNSQRWLTEQYAAQMNVPHQAQGDLYDMYHDQAKDTFEQNQAMRPVNPVADVEEARLMRQIDITVLDADQLRLTFFTGEEADAYAVMTVSYFHQLLHILQLKTEALEWELPVEPLVADSYQYGLQ
mgnify:CR=1 FL=1